MILLIWSKLFLSSLLLEISNSTKDPGEVFQDTFRAVFCESVVV